MNINRKSVIAICLSALLVGLFSLPVTSAEAPPVLPNAFTPLEYITHPNVPPDAGHGGGGGGGGSTSCVTTLPSPNGATYSPSQVKTAYQYSSTATGSGETIAIIDAYGSSSLTSDLKCFDSQFGLPAPTLQIVQPFGNPHGSNSGWGLETSLDVEWAHAMAPAAAILLIIVPSASLTYLINDAVPYAVSHGANVISMSWGAAESSSSCSTWQSESSYFSNAASAGVIPVASSGDSGAYDGTNSPTVIYPASDPSVLGVGGTTLTLTSSSSWSSEVAWNDQYGSSGGGVSSCFSEPSYQSSSVIQVTTSSASAMPSGRSVPDVAYNADVLTGFWVYDTSGYSGWVQVGGTSAGAPQWSAIVADALSSGTGLNAGSIHSSLYSLIGTSNLHDITTGNNNYYYATSAYDAATGIGTPVESTLLPVL
jgi:subtilase family serine protease